MSIGSMFAQSSRLIKLFKILIDNKPLNPKLVQQILSDNQINLDIDNAKKLADAINRGEIK